MAERQRNWSNIAENAVLLGVHAAGVVLPVGQAIKLVQAVRGTKGGDEAFARRLLDGIEGWCQDRHDTVGDLPPGWKDRLLDRLDGPVSPAGIGVDALTATVFSAAYTEGGPDKVDALTRELARAMPELILRADSRLGAALEALLAQNFTELGQRLGQIQADVEPVPELAAAAETIEGYLARLLRREVTDLLVHEPFPARDVDLTRSGWPPT